MVWRAATGCQVENTASFGPNVVSFLLILGARQWYIVGAYMPPNDGPRMHCVEQALQAVPKGLELILMGSLNARLGDPRDEREEELVMALVDRGLVNMTDYFLPRIQYWGAGGWIWSMQRDERQVTGRGDYILSTDRRIFFNAWIWETRHGTDHRLILAVLWGEGVLCNRCCRRGRTHWPIRPKPIRP